MKRLLLPLLFVGCTNASKDDALPSIDALPERNEVILASETIAMGAISLTLDAKVQRDGEVCTLHATVKQTASDNGPVYEELGDSWTLERGYLHRGDGAWSEAFLPIEGAGRQLEGKAKGAPSLDGEANVVVRLVRKDDRAHYLAKRNVPITCAD